jgi:DNA-binding response OmpR family regulator
MSGGDVPSTVLIVEDAETVASALEILFSSIPGLKIITASSAEQAWRLLDEGPEPIRALVTDVQLPEMDGFELIGRVRSHASFGSLPIIVITGLTDPDVARRLRSCGADAVFTKPYSPTQVREKLEQFLYHDFRTR